MSFPPFDSMARLVRVRAALADQGLDGLLVTRMVNVRYLCGFTGSAGLLYLPFEGQPVLMTDGRYTTQAGEQLSVDADLRIRGDDGYRPILQEVVTHGRVGLEAEGVTWAEAKRLEAWLSGRELVATHGLVEQVRARKDPGELARLARAVEIGDQTFSLLLPEMRPGLTELHLAARLEASFKELGASGPSFDSIVAFGARSAMPHAQPTAAELAPGDLVVLDFGCMVDGYCSDMTRTVVVGSATSRQREVYEVVSAAQEAARSAILPGAAAGDADRAARQVITDAGYGDAFSHSVGHGVGLEIHEAPWLRATSADVLEPGHVVTDEPGVYLPGFGGVRIEDQLVVTDTGCRTLTRSPKDLAAVTIAS